MKNIIFLLLITVVACKKNNTSTGAINNYQVTHAVQAAYYIDTVDTVFPADQSFYVNGGVINKNLHFVKYGPSTVFAVETVYNKTTLQIGGYRAAFDIDSFYHYSGDTIAKKSIFVQQILLIKEL